MQLTPLEIQNALLFLGRVDIKGSESLPHAELTIKLQAIHTELTAPKPAAPPPPPQGGSKTSPGATPIDGKKEA